MGSAENAGGFVMKESSVATSHRLALSVVDTRGRAYVDTLELRAPLPPSALVIDPSLGSDRLGITWTKSTSPDAAQDIDRADEHAENQRDLSLAYSPAVLAGVSQLEPADLDGTA